MKKHNIAVILILIALNLAVGFLLGAVIGYFIGDPVLNWCHIIIIPFLLMGFPDLTNLIVFPFSKRTMAKNLEKENFGKTTTLVTHGVWVLKSMLCIDEDTGRVAYVPVTNPFKFQMVNATELSKIRTSHVKGPFGAGARSVFLEFYQGNKKFRFYIFRTRRITWELSSNRVKNAYATGNRICDLLLKFNPNGNDFTINRNIPFSKLGLRGFILSFISIYVTVAALTYRSLISVSNGEKLPKLYVPFFALSFIGAVLAILGLVLGIKVLKDASGSPVRGRGFAKTAIIMSSIILIIQLLLLVFYFV